MKDIKHLIGKVISKYQFEIIDYNLIGKVTHEVETLLSEHEVNYKEVKTRTLYQKKIDTEYTHSLTPHDDIKKDYRYDKIIQMESTIVVDVYPLCDDKVDETTLNEVEEMCISEEYEKYYIVKMPKKEVQHFLRINKCRIIHQRVSGDKAVFYLEYLS